jgi:predicted SnoaL-like aldol condensation-catalyzing enzyme
LPRRTDSSVAVKTVSERAEDERMAANARPSTRKSIVDDFFRLVGEGRPRDGLRYFSPGCVQHNPHVNGGIDALFDSMMAAMKEKASKISQPDFSVRYVLEDRDTVAVYTQLYNRSNRKWVD